MKRWAFKLVLLILTGAIINVAVAWGCASWSVPRSSDHDSVSLSDTQAPCWLVIRSHRFGHDQLMLQSLSGDEYVRMFAAIAQPLPAGTLEQFKCESLTTPPDCLQRCFVVRTSCGWPCASLWWEGHGTLDLSQRLSDDMVVHRGLRITATTAQGEFPVREHALPLGISVSGFIVDTLVYSAAVALLVAGLGRVIRHTRRLGWSRRDWIRRSVLLTFIMAAGAAVNVAVAWACVLWSPRSPNGQPPMRFRVDRWELTALVDDRCYCDQADFTAESDDAGLGVVATNGSMAPMVQHAPPPEQSDWLMVVAGWPMLAFEGYSCSKTTNDYSADQGAWTSTIQHASASGLFKLELLSASQLLPWKPLGLGFAINTIFYSAIVWLLFFAPSKLLRWRRMKRGLCPACAYPIGTSDKCTECGKAVPQSPGIESTASCPK